jgi:general stress protein YciG
MHLRTRPLVIARGAAPRGVAAGIPRKPLNEARRDTCCSSGRWRCRTPQGALFTAEDRRQATAAGLHGSEASGSRGRNDADESFLVRRSEFAFERIATRAPAFAQAERRARWPAWIGWALPGLALIVGVATNEIDGGGRLNIIAFPLLGMLAWNLAVYAALFAAWLRGLGRARRGRAAGPRRALGWARRARRRGRGTVRARDRQFVRDWLRLLGAHRSPHQPHLHLGRGGAPRACCWACTHRASGWRYRAGGESTSSAPRP